MERLSKYVAQIGALSRRKAEEIIRSGKVKVNSEIISNPAHQINSKDKIMIDGKGVEPEWTPLYIALHKPAGYMSDLDDTRDRKIARNLIKIDGKLFPVGRLDYNSEGLIIFTNDGDFANSVMHPRYEVEKEYLVKIKGVLKQYDIDKMKKGLLIEGDLYKIENIKFVEMAKRLAFRSPQAKNENKGRTAGTSRANASEAGVGNAWYRITVKEGKNRMIRKIGDAVGHTVLKLKRIRIGNLHISDLKPGEYRFIDKNEVFGPRKKRK